MERKEKMRRNRRRKQIGETLVCALLSAVLLTGCKGGEEARTDGDGEKAGAENTLEIYIQDLGYGTQWLRDEIALFQEQDWVKEKYPDLYIPEISYNSQYGYGMTQIKAGEKANSADLFFISAEYDLQKEVDANGNHYIESLNDVFEGKVPGEEVLYRDKMYPAFEQSCRYDGTYWSTVWAASYQGFLYNADLFEALGLSVPRTTDEMLALCGKVSAEGAGNDAYGKDYTVMLSTSREEANYWQYIAFPIWWAQYEGIENYYNFWKGIDTLSGTADSKDVFAQQGRLESMKVIYELIHDYSFNGAGSIDFIEAQTRFLSGDGLIMVNGDWFFQEMGKTVQGLKESGIDYDIRFMKPPVISALRDELATINDDETLAAVVGAVDRGEAGYESVSPEDFQRVREARSFVYTDSYLQQAFIPSYALGKELAKDFLRFLATDEALCRFMKSTGGAALPFAFDVSAYDPTAYEVFDGIQRYRDEIYAAGVEFILPARYEEFPLAYLGGMKAVPVGFMDSAFGVSGGKDAQTFFREQIDYYTQAKWDDTLRNSGKK